MRKGRKNQYYIAFTNASGYSSLNLSTQNYPSKPTSKSNIALSQQDGAYTFRFQSAFLPASRVGEYTAIVKGEDVTLTWTHDGTNIDHSAGDPDCAVWGQSQIKAYLAVDSGERYLWTA
ncbi:MAG: hypothetical protein IJ952_00740, partial [Alistipes sp.]|nr:hypothetical protein [Alistipes sp.]